MGRKKDPLYNLKTYPDTVGDVRCSLTYVYDRIDDSAGPNACWSYTGAKHRQGYGMVGGIRIATGKKIMMTVHRLLLKIKLGHNPGDHVDAMHTCGNMTCVNPDHIVEGNAKEILELRVKRTGIHFGKPRGSLLNKPRNQTYVYGFDNIVDLAQERMSPEEFARRTGITEAQAKKIKWNIDTGRGYRWAKTWKGN